MERSEDLKQVRDLRLVRDERDREVEAEAGRRAGNAVLLVTQLLAAACLLQGDPAWMALLSLTFIWGAVKGFCRFGQDREKLYLAWGLLTAAGAAILLGAYFRQAWSAGMSFSRLVGYAVLCRVLVMIAGLLWAGLLLGIFWLAHRIGHMEGDPEAPEAEEVTARHLVTLPESEAGRRGIFSAGAYYSGALPKGIIKCNNTAEKSICDRNKSDGRSLWGIGCACSFSAETKECGSSCQKRLDRRCSSAC